ncbi:hypothetical protein J4050_07240 [Winogradskyella sp. DF17]|jgi:hypothetical protein|uniref:DUF4149 domain-containing protein n=1 Tax=Winogradskyella pelagia TaxID=2819984 RepID=A0ABS3T1B0_9FLAO|nr:hypothetical protein [Winogradskyella sp. DF17]MBO3116534.1 hypothetical protein [Winogradskyella sp. DF17]
MTLDIIRLLVDTGFLILIWAVQLVIYPSFKFYTSKNLMIWHKEYTFRVTFIVLPLMFSQLVLSVYQFWHLQNWYTISSMAIVTMLWLLTFLIFVPLHQSIDKAKPVNNVCQKLVSKNWMRTVLWSALFIISVINVISN